MSRGEVSVAVELRMEMHVGFVVGCLIGDILKCRWCD